MAIEIRSQTAKRECCHLFDGDVNRPCPNKATKVLRDLKGCDVYEYTEMCDEHALEHTRLTDIVEPIDG